MPRIVFGMINRGGGIVSFGVIKSNLPAHMTWLREGEEVLCLQDGDNHTLEVATRQDAGPAPARDNDIEAVAAAIGDLNRKGIKVFKSGQHGLWEQKLASLSHLSRTFIQRAVDSLVECDRVEMTPDGLFLRASDADYNQAA
jgi:hypothetical protein